MCLITYAPDKSYLNMDKLKVAMDVNPDGFGIVFAKDKELHYAWRMEGYELFERLIKERVPDDVPLAIHFRMTTHGETTTMNSHPFPILTTKKHGRALCMMHNGVISSIYDTGSKKSDTLLYIEKILSPILTKSPELIYDVGFQLLLSRDIMGGNKFLFLDGDGRHVIINPQSGKWDEKDKQVWYSNEYSFNAYHRQRHNTSHGTQINFPYGGEGYEGMYGTSSAATTNSNHTVEKSTKEFKIVPNQSRANAIATLPKDFIVEPYDIPHSVTYSISHDEVLLRKIDEAGDLRYGWVLNVSKGTIKQFNYLIYRHSQYVGDTLKKLFAERRDALKAKAAETKGTNVVPLETSHKSLVSKAQENAELADKMMRECETREFRLMTEGEIMEWIVTYPDECAKYLMKNGWFGSAKGIEKGLNENQMLLDIAADFITRKSRGLQMTEAINQHLVPDDVAASMCAG